MDIVKTNAMPIADNDFVKLKSMGNIQEIVYSRHKSNGGYITKVSKDNYIDNRTGELKEFNHIENRSQDLQNVAKTLSMGRDLINTNVTNVSYCRWVTLTYKENMTDTSKLYNDFKNFNKRCRAIFGHYEYIICVEPQGRGAWHIHALLIFDHKAPFMDSNIIAECWKQGFVKVKKLDNCDNVGAYLTAYLGDLDVSTCESENIYTDNKRYKIVEYEDDNGIKQSKKYIKGARLYLYPPGMHIFRWSKGIKKPIVENLRYKNAKEKVSSAKLTYSKSVLLSDNENDFNNLLTYEYYNTIINVQG